MIRPTEPADTRALLALTAQTGVFKPHEIQALDEVLTDYHATNSSLGHRSVTFEKSGEILGFAYYAPAAMTDRTWYLYWIAVTKHTQARGIGSTAAEIRRRRHSRAAGTAAVDRNVVAAVLRADAQVLSSSTTTSRPP